MNEAVQKQVLPSIKLAGGPGMGTTVLEAGTPYRKWACAKPDRPDRLKPNVIYP